ncbi:MAG TPA: aminotransferase class I/II-fold pyridoxal phosphate-dependent enzyme, partial [Escherichia coli]|nr:aminotransferase class I/II-fold pyridoxal phosphate-dependent enzyme [Escherichia coli]
MFQKVDAYAGDPILTLMERFKEDPRSDKVNLSIGLYYNEDGIIPQLKAVADAEARLNAQPHGASLYLPMEGLNCYRHAIAPLLFGADHPVLKQQRVATIQTLGGSGALKVGADFLKRIDGGAFGTIRENFQVSRILGDADVLINGTLT